MGYYEDVNLAVEGAKRVPFKIELTGETLDSGAGRCKIVSMLRHPDPIVTEVTDEDGNVSTVESNDYIEGSRKVYTLDIADIMEYKASLFVDIADVCDKIFSGEIN